MLNLKLKTIVLKNFGPKSKFWAPIIFFVEICNCLSKFCLKFAASVEKLQLLFLTHDAAICGRTANTCSFLKPSPRLPNLSDKTSIRLKWIKFSQLILRKIIELLPPDLMFKSYNAPHSISAGASPQTPPRELTARRQIPGRILGILLLRESQGRVRIREKRRRRKKKGKRRRRERGRGRADSSLFPNSHFCLYATGLYKRLPWAYFLRATAECFARLSQTQLPH